MPTYRVFMTQEVSTVVEVEADNPEAAVEAAFNSPKMPGSITQGAFGGGGVDGTEWEARVVMDETDAEVWKGEA